MTERQFYDYYTDYDVLITGMNEKLLEAQMKNPSMDSDRALQKINMLRRLQVAFHTLYHFNQSVDNSSGKVMMERDTLLKRIAQLERENTELKESIKL